MVNKIHKFTGSAVANLIRGEDNGSTQAYEMKSLTYEVCAVCREQHYNFAAGFILVDDVIRNGRWFYIVFENHPACRQLALLNPLAYLE